MIDWRPLFPVVRQAIELTYRVRALALDPSDKSSNDPVTIADYGAQALILHALSHLHPNAAVIAEERSEQYLSLVSDESRKVVVSLLSDIMSMPVQERDVVAWLDFGAGRDADTLWTVDPIDGTRGYVGGRRYCVALGVMHRRVPAAGLLACPRYPLAGKEGTLFYTADGQAYAEPLPGGVVRRIQVREGDDPTRFQAIGSTDNSEHDVPIIERVCAHLGVAPGQIGLYDGQDKYAIVAAGEADFYLRPERPNDRPHYIWDHVPGFALLRAAGGTAIDLTGQTLDFTHGNRLPRLGLIVSSARASERVLAALQAVISTP